MYLAPSPSKWGQLLELSKHSIWIQPANKAIQMPFSPHTSNKQISILCVLSTIQEPGPWLFLKAKIKPQQFWFFFFSPQSFFSRNILSWKGLTKTTKSNCWPCTGKPHSSPQQIQVCYIYSSRTMLITWKDKGIVNVKPRLTLIWRHRVSKITVCFLCTNSGT